MPKAQNARPTATTRTYDLAIIGAGSAAKSAAGEARRRGKSVVMVERATPGGTCLNVGCVPSKHLLAAAAVRATAAGEKFPGIETAARPVDLAALVEDKDRFLAQLRDRDHIKGTAAAGIDLLQGDASFAPATQQERPTLIVADEHGEETRITAERVLVASGAQPFIPPVPGLRDVEYLTSSTAMSLKEIPGSLLVVGGNAIGLEQAQLFARLGSDVTVVEMAPRIAPFEDPDISEALEKALSGEGITFRTGANLTGVRPGANGIVASVAVEGGALDLAAEKILIATGRRPVTRGLNLEAVAVPTGPRGEIMVDEHLRTAHPRIWAAGDVTGQHQFVYVAGAQGVAAVSNMYDGEPQPLDYTALPRVTFTSPALASVGMTATDAAAAGMPYETRELPLAFVPRAMIARNPDGIVKLVSDPRTGKLLGVHMVGAEAGEVITAATYALSAGLTVQQLAGTWSPFLTMAESLRIAATMPPVVTI
ncbi:mercury(II) reductase [Streptomyces violens]|uniref:mercury(II) reductase n=1 Tax=Streptomyces violens TaxID=66377 RepID=UPI00068ED5FA|nr:mercury(II) reductase [Streptomyces violens]